MMKRLLLSLVALLTVLGTYADAKQAGDYVFTPDGRYKLTGSNLVANGDFSTTSGWLNTTGGGIDVTAWNLVPGVGLQGRGATEGNDTVYQAIPFTSGQTIVVSMTIQGTADGQTTAVLAAGAQNIVQVYANATGVPSVSEARFQQVSTATAIGVDPVEVSYMFQDTISGGSTGYLIIEFANFMEGVTVSDVTAYVANTVYDTRIAQRALDYANALAAIEGLDESKNRFTSAIRNLTNAIGDPLQDEDAEGMTNLVNTLQTRQEAWLDANSTNMASKITSFDFEQWTKFNEGDGKDSYGDWLLTGGRWGHKAIGGGNSAPYQPYIQKDQPTDLTAGAAYISKTGMEPGRYLFSIEGLFYKQSSKWIPLNVDDEYQLCDLFFGEGENEQTVTMTLNGRTFTRHLIVGTVGEDGKLVVGARFNGFPEGTTGASFRLQYAVLRLLGVSAATGHRNNRIAGIVTQQNALKERIDRATEYIANNDYPWGKDDYRTALETAEEAYNASLNVINENGEVVMNGDEDPQQLEPKGESGTDQDNTKYADELLAAVQAMNTAHNNYVNANKPYADLVARVAEVEETLANPAYDTANKSAINSKVAEAKTLINDAPSYAPVGDADGYNNMREELNSVMFTFQAEYASIDAPAPMVVVNPYFAQYSGKNGTYKATGWDIIAESSNGGWKYSSGDGFETGAHVHFDRGWTSYPKNKATQKLTLTKKGLYIVSCKAYAYSIQSGVHQAFQITEEVPAPTEEEPEATTTKVVGYTSGYFFFAGKEGESDSLAVYTDSTTINGVRYAVGGIGGSKGSSANITLEDGTTTSVQYSCPPNPYQIQYLKEADGEEVLEFGIDGLNNYDAAGGGGIHNGGFGDVKVTFYGDPDAYASGIKASQFVAPQQEGIYSLTGVRLNSLPQKGIYIRDGKKYVVK